MLTPFQEVQKLANGKMIRFSDVLALPVPSSPILILGAVQMTWTQDILFPSKFNSIFLESIVLDYYIVGADDTVLLDSEYDSIASIIIAEQKDSWPYSNVDVSDVNTLQQSGTVLGKGQYTECGLGMLGSLTAPARFSLSISGAVKVPVAQEYFPVVSISMRGYAWVNI